MEGATPGYLHKQAAKARPGSSGIPLLLLSAPSSPSESEPSGVLGPDSYTWPPWVTTHVASMGGKETLAGWALP